jgi:hypothetical protein
MAVVQISKIQVRRGLKNSGIGVPQLSSAEFAWAIDTQELFIGNGALSEGAPFVGNTKILTENDNLLELASSYQFGANVPAIIESVPRSLQSKLDEIAVSVVDFGAVGDGSSSSDIPFANALRDLFQNSDEKLRKVLIVPNGEYVFTSDIRIPSSTIIRGETQNGAILNIGAFNIVFLTESGTEVQPGIESTDRPSNNVISNITIKRSTGQVVLTGVRDSLLEDVKFQGEYSLIDSVPLDSDSTLLAALTSTNSAIFWANTLEGNKVTGISLKRCIFENLELAIKSIQTPETFETVLNFVDCEFSVNDVCFYVEGVPTQQTRWKIKDCKFNEIANQVFWANAGQGYMFQGCEFFNCGNGTNDASSPNTEILYFGESTNNIVIDCVANRHQNALLTSEESTVGYSETFNTNLTNFVNFQFTEIFVSDSATTLCVFSSESKFITISYTLKLGDHVRRGKVSIVIDETNTDVSISDEYQYSRALSDDRDAPLSEFGGRIMTNFEFSAILANNDVEAGIDTVIVKYTNPLDYGIVGTLSYQVSYGV